ncbi:MAG: hypothetical protein IPN47_20030 [Gemmatimonadetes bacterium]|nr:hypothetical protein [Gemmatimonadota bacterium]
MFLAVPGNAEAQATQAAAHLAGRTASIARDTLTYFRNLALGYMAEVAVHQLDESMATPAAVRRLARSTSRLRETGELIRRTPVGDPTLRRALRELEIAVQDFKSEATLTRSELESDARAREWIDRAVAANFSLPPTFPHTLEPKVAFTVGVATGICEGCATTFDLGTSLVGSALGAVVGALGAPDALKEYFAQNVALGIGLPTRSSRRISSGVSLGLGGVDVKQVSFWPVLGMQQADSGDAALPQVVKTTEPTQATWSTPYFGIAFVPMNRKRLDELLARQTAVPIITVGVRLPQYYPGDAGTALAALFTSKQGKYLGAGHAALVMSVSVPLFRADSSKEPAVPQPRRREYAGLRGRAWRAARARAPLPA